MQRWVWSMAMVAIVEVSANMTATMYIQILLSERAEAA
jgi:hypothetical protein